MLNKRQSGVFAALMLSALAFASVAHARSNSQTRQLASAKMQVQSLTRHVHALRGTINFYHGKGHWTLHTRFKKCYQVTGWQRVRVCQHARRTLAAVTEQLPSLEKDLLLKRIHVEFLQIDPAEISAFTCIHGGEGSWTSNTGNGYYGGLQMDLGFQKTYGSEFLALWGTADNWPIEAQYIAAHRAKVGYGGYGARGYGPWPKTGPACGL